VVVVAALPLLAEVATEAPVEVKNPILPVANEMFWAAVGFVVLWALMKYVLLPPIMKGMEARAEKIRTDLEAAEAASTQAEASVHEYDASLASTRAEAVRLVEDARARAEGERRDKIAAAEAEAATQRAEAAQEVTAAKQQAKAELHDSIAGIAVGAAEAVVQKPLDRSEQMQVIEDYVNRAGSQN